MILIARQYNLPSTRYIFPRSTGQNFDSGFKLDLAVLDDNPPPYLGSPVRNEALLIQSGSSVAPNKVSSYCLHTYPRCPGAGAGRWSATSQLLREVCPRPLSSTLPGQISRCHTSVITVDMDTKYISLGTGAPPSQPNTPARSYRYQCINVSNNGKWLL